MVYEFECRYVGHELVERKGRRVVGYILYRFEEVGSKDEYWVYDHSRDLYLLERISSSTDKLRISGRVVSRGKINFLTLGGVQCNDEVWR